MVSFTVAHFFKHFGYLFLFAERRLQVIAPQPNPFTGEVDYEGPSESTYDTEEDLSAQDLVNITQTTLNIIVKVLGIVLEPKREMNTKDQSNNCTLTQENDI